MTEYPLIWRVAEPWLAPAGGSLFSHKNELLTWETMENVEQETKLRQYLDWLVRLGFNGFCLTFSNRTNVNDVEDHTAAFLVFSRYLEKVGLRFFIRRAWNECEAGPREAEVEPGQGALRRLSPFDEEVRDYWRDRISRDYALIPNLSGHKIQGSEAYLWNGAPWMGDCRDATTGRECLIEAMRLIGGELKSRGGILFWESCQDDPWAQRQERHYFCDLAKEIPSNSFVIIKSTYWDYHPGWPAHPLFWTFPQDNQHEIPYLTSIQLPGEYTGWADTPWCMADDITEAVRTIHDSGQQGLWVMQLPLQEPPWDHPLNGVNWHTLDAHLHGSQATAAELKQEWAYREYGNCASTILDILDKLTEAARGMLEFDGLWTANHSRFPSLLDLDSRLCGPYRRTTRMKGMMGMIWPLDMYPPDTAAGFQGNPQTSMVFGQAPITARLKSEAMTQKENAVNLMRAAAELWHSLRGTIDNHVHVAISVFLKKGLCDAIIFRHMMDLYMDLKLGNLTETKIDKALEACRDLKGNLIPSPLGSEPELAPEPAIFSSTSTFKVFAEQLRRELQTPWLENHWQRNPTGGAVVRRI